MELQSVWGTGFCMGSVAVKNTGNQAVLGWELTFDLPNATIASDWSGSASRSGDRVTVIPPNWGRKIAAGATVRTYGFCANGDANSAQPKNIKASTK